MAHAKPRQRSRLDKKQSKDVIFNTSKKELQERVKEIEVVNQAQQEKEDTLESKIHELSERYHLSDSRAEFAERSVDKLETTIDNLLNDLYAQKMSYKLGCFLFNLTILSISEKYNNFITRKFKNTQHQVNLRKARFYFERNDEAPRVNLTLIINGTFALSSVYSRIRTKLKSVFASSKPK